ncbi:hypothetical protein GWI34_05560 [Actinomadura sp. DSM 109109]|nr:hypothetical protein [Actinomadura lepetitiana]
MKLDKKHRGLIVGCVIGLAISGCSTSKKSAAPTGPVPTPTPTSAAQISLPLEAYLPSPGSLAESGALTSLLTRQCMRGYGFMLPGPTDLAKTIESSTRIDRFLMSRRYGISDRSIAERYGYRTPEWTLGSSQPHSLNDMSPQAKAVLTGSSSGTPVQGKRVPPGGCMSQARRQVGEPSSNNGLASQLQNKTFEQLRNAPGARSAITQWSQCMEMKGYRYPDPWRAGVEFARDDEGGEGPGRSEIKSALATVDCSYGTNFIGKMFAIESDLQNAEIERNAEALSKEKKKLEAQARRLQGLVKQYGG